MEKAYIILAHKNPGQLLRLVTRLDDDRSTFYIHIDKRVDISQFDPVINYSEKVRMINREHSHWGGIGLVKATLNGLQAIHKNASFDRVILLSGQDYPIKSNEFIDSFLKNVETEIFLEHTTLPDIKRWKDSGGLYRVNKYYFGLKIHQKYVAKAINLGARFIPTLKRKYVSKLQYYAGSQWWVINRYAVDYILNYIKENPGYTRFHKYTFAPDEVYFHTILLNCIDKRIYQNINNSSIMYMKWLSQSSSHPEILKKEDVADLLTSNRLFARKFDQEINTDVFDLIDFALKNKI